MHSRALMTAAVLTAVIGVARAEMYQDPQQRFALSVPPGWTAEPFDQGVHVLVQGTELGFCRLEVGVGGPGGSLLDSGEGGAD